MLSGIFVGLVSLMEGLEGVKPAARMHWRNF
jgi:hypothetical protein